MYAGDRQQPVLAPSSSTKSTLTRSREEEREEGSPESFHSAQQRQEEEEGGRLQSLGLFSGRLSTFWSLFFLFVVSCPGNAMQYTVVGSFSMRVSFSTL